MYILLSRIISWLMLQLCVLMYKKIEKKAKPKGGPAITSLMVHLVYYTLMPKRIEDIKIEVSGA